MTIVVDLFDYIALCVLVVMIGGAILIYVTSLIGYAISRLIVKIQERLWKK